MVVDVSKLVAGINFSPSKWQSAAPDVLCNKPPVPRTPALDRVLALPRRPTPTPADFAGLIAHMTARLARPPGACRCRELAPKRFKDGANGCITELRGPQAWALWEAMQVGGILGILAVGSGKTAIGLLAPLVVPNCKTALLLVPANLVKQLVEDYHLLAQHFYVPSLVVHGTGGRSFTVPGAPAVHVLSYNRLSVESAATFIEGLRPDLVIADECDSIRHADTSRTARVLRYFRDHPETRFCGWSGSVTDSSLHDYAHLLALALKERSPLPLPVEEALEPWAEALDAVPYPRPGGALLQGLLAYGFMAHGEHLRDGFRRRLHETPGVVHSTESPVTVELVIREREAPPLPTKIAAALDELRLTWQRPDGEELVDALSVSKCARELACGFFYRWIFPRREPVPLILEWLDARKEWHKELRLKLKRREEHLDSEKLCTNAARRAHGDLAQPERGLPLPVWKASTWPRWRDIADKVDPTTQAVRIDDFLARDAAAWARSNLGIVWYDAVEFGEWVAELSGLPLHRGGPKAGELIGKETGERSIIASLKSHGRGRNGLQFLFSDQLIAQPPSNATGWEQLLGRTHRPGQIADEVSAWYYAHTKEMREAYEQANERAVYVETTMGAAQKIRIAMHGK